MGFRISIILLLISTLAYSQCPVTIHARGDSGVFCKLRVRNFGGTGLLKTNSNGNVTVATAGSDYLGYTGTATYVPYFSTANALTSEAGFTYDETLNILFVPGLRSTGSITMSGGMRSTGTSDANTYNLISNNTVRIAISSAGLIGLGVPAPTPTSNLTVGGSFALPYVAKTGTYTISSTDFLIECTANTFTVTLPTAASITGRIYGIKNTGAGTITLATTSSQTIDGSTTITILTNEYKEVMSNGANWIIK